MERSPLGVERSRFYLHAARLLGDRLDPMGCAVFLPQLYAFWNCSGAVGVRCASPRSAWFLPRSRGVPRKTNHGRLKFPVREICALHAVLFRPFMASAWVQRGHPLVGHLATAALWAAKTFGFMECALCTSRRESPPKTGNDTCLQGCFKP